MFNLYSLKVSVQFMTPTSQFSPWENIGPVYKPHPQSLVRNLSKKVWLIHKSLWYVCILDEQLFRSRTVIMCDISVRPVIRFEPTLLKNWPPC